MPSARLLRASGGRRLGLFIPNCFPFPWACLTVSMYLFQKLRALLVEGRLLAYVRARNDCVTPISSGGDHAFCIGSRFVTTKGSRLMEKTACHSVLQLARLGERVVRMAGARAGARAGGVIRDGHG